MAKMTNRQFAETDKYFIECCKRTNVKPTTRQASKFRNKRGLAYTEGRSKKTEKEG